MLIVPNVLDTCRGAYSCGSFLFAEFFFSGCTSGDIFCFETPVHSLSSFQECCAIAYLKTYKS